MNIIHRRSFWLPCGGLAVYSFVQEMHSNIANTEETLDQCIEDCAHEEIDASHVRKHCNDNGDDNSVLRTRLHTCYKCERSNVVIENTKGRLHNKKNNKQQHTPTFLLALQLSSQFQMNRYLFN